MRGGDNGSLDHWPSSSAAFAEQLAFPPPAQLGMPEEDEAEELDRDSMAAATRLLSADFSETQLWGVIESLPSFKIAPTQVAACVGRLSCDGSAAHFSPSGLMRSISSKRTSVSGLALPHCAELGSISSPQLQLESGLDWFYAGWENTSRRQPGTDVAAKGGAAASAAPSLVPEQQAGTAPRRQ